MLFKTRNHVRLKLNLLYGISLFISLLNIFKTGGVYDLLHIYIKWGICWKKKDL